MVPDERCPPFFDALLWLADAVQRGEDLTLVMRRSAEALMRYLGADRCIVVLLEEDRFDFEAAGWSVEGDKLSAPEESLSHFLLREVEHAGEAVLIDNATKDRRWRSEADQRSGKCQQSLLGIPVFHRRVLKAVFSLSNETVAIDFDPDDRLLLLFRRIFALLFAASFAAAEEEPHGRGGSGDTVASKAKSSGVSGAGAAPVPHKTKQAGEVLFSRYGFYTKSEKLAEVLRDGEKIAPSRLPVLVTGENGTGKDKLAHMLHLLSGCTGPFVTVNCSTIPHTLIEAELFGYRKGAFSGAAADRTGLVAAADGGTLYLNDLQEMRLESQAVFLRVLSEGMIRPLGSEQVQQVSFRLLTSATVPVGELRARGLIRDDLLYRIQTAVLELPPLRRRPEDILFLFERFYRSAGKQNEQNGTSVALLTPEAENLLLLHSWPGNVRELENEAKRLRALVESPIQAGDLSFAATAAGVGKESRVLSPLQEAVRRAEKETIEKALELAGGNKTKAARMVGMTRRSLYRRLKEYNIK